MTHWFETIKRSKDSCFVALHHDDATALRAQLSAGRSVTEKFHANRTLLHIAAALGATRCVEVLLEQGADIEALTEFGENSALMEAVEYRRAETARLLLKKGARIRYAAQEEPFKIARLLVEKGVVKLSPEAREVYALELCNDVETLRLLVEEYRCDVDHHDGAGYWPLKTFAEQGNAAAVEFLLSHGADPNFTSTGASALHAAVLANSVECVRLLLKAGANPNQQDVDGCVPMYFIRSHDVLDLLLQFGADPNVGDQAGCKPSYWVDEPSLKTRLLGLEKKQFP
jgi:ankyrin repeat protein